MSGLENKKEVMKKSIIDGKNKIENLLIPVLLFLFSFYDFNKGIDLRDSGFSLSRYLHFDTYEGSAIISTFWSNFLGHCFSMLPGGQTWIGLSFYCTFIIAGTVLVAYFLCKKIMDYRIVAICEVLAIFFCWNPNTVLYDYLSFFLFTLAIYVLVMALEKDNRAGYVLAGIVLGINTFVRIPNIAEIAAIVLLWYYGYAKKWKFFIVVKRTLLCVTGYVSGVAVSLAVIISRYGFGELKLAFYNLLYLSQTQENYGIIYMATQTFMVVLQYGKYVLPVLAMLIPFTILLLVTKKNKNVQLIIKVCFFVLTICCYYFMAKKFKWYNWCWTAHESVLGLASIFLLWGILCSVLMIFLSKNIRMHLAALIYIGVFFVTPLGSNNNIYLEIMNMFLLIPINVGLTMHLFRDHAKEIKRDWQMQLVNSIKVVMCASAVIMFVHVCGYGLNYVFNDVIEEKASENTYAGMYSSEERITELDQLYSFCEENELLGKEAIFYCNSPGLSFILDMPTPLTSAWADWYTYTFYEFYDGMEAVQRDSNNGKEMPVVILNTQYQLYCEGEIDQLKEMGIYIPDLEGDEKLLFLSSFLKENNYECIYKGEEYAIYYQ